MAIKSCDSDQGKQDLAAHFNFLKDLLEAWYALYFASPSKNVIQKS